MAIKKITLCWYAKTGSTWKYFPAILENFHGMKQARHGWVLDKGQLVEYPVGRYVLRSYVEGRKVYHPVESCNPRDAVLALNHANRVARLSGDAQGRLALIRHAAKAYIDDCRQRGVLEAAAQARLTLDEFVPRANATYVSSVTRDTILKYHAAMRARGLSERTIANRHDRLKAFFRWCKVDTTFMPPTPRYEKGLPTIYTSKETAAILDGADEYMRLAILMGLKLGLRELEIAHAEWSDVHWEDSVFRVQGKLHWDWKIKDAEMRDIPIPVDVMGVLKTWRKKHSKTKLIVGTASDKPNWHLLRTLKRLAKRQSLNCGQCDGCKSESEECANWTLHKLRRTYGTTLLRQGVDARTVQAWMGHADLSSTLRYLRPSAAKESQDKVNAVDWSK